jgi:hypothetical protein
MEKKYPAYGVDFARIDWLEEKGKLFAGFHPVRLRRPIPVKNTVTMWEGEPGLEASIVVPQVEELDFFTVDEAIPVLRAALDERMRKLERINADITFCVLSRIRNDKKYRELLKDAISNAEFTEHTTGSAR